MFQSVPSFVPNTRFILREQMDPKRKTLTSLGRALALVEAHPHRDSAYQDDDHAWPDISFVFIT